MVASLIVAVALQTVATVQRIDAAPIEDAIVTFIGADGTRERIRTNATGRAAATFAATRLVVTAQDCARREVAVKGPSTVVVLDCAPPAIGSVRVATGSFESLHRLPVAASVLDAQQTAQSPALTGDALLRVLPGFDRDRSNSGFTNYGQVRVSFAGAGTDRGLVLADGIPAQDGFGGQIDWAEYPSRDIARAELLRGPGSALYGAGAIGGVLSLETFGPKNEPSAPANGWLALSAGSHASSSSYLHSTVNPTPELAASLSLSQQHMQYADLPPGYASPIDREADSEESMASLRFRYVPSASAIIEYGYRGAWDHQEEGRSNYNFGRRLHQNSIRIVHPTQRSSAALGYFVRSTALTNTADLWPNGPPGALRYTQEVGTHESGVGATWIVESPHSTFGVRADGRFVTGQSQQFGPSGVFQSAGSGTQSLAGLAMQETFTGPRMQFVVGARGDLVAFASGQLLAASKPKTTLTSLPARVDRALSPRAAVRFDLSKNLALRLSDGLGFRAPFLNELLRGFQIGSTVYLPNAGLLPERSASFSSGLDWADARQEVALDLVRTAVNNAIGFRTIGPNRQMRSNLGQTQTDGATFVYRRLMGRCTRLSLSGTSQYARVIRGAPATLGKQLAYVPRAAATFGVEGQAGRIHGGFDVSYLGPTFADDLNTQPLGTALIAGTHFDVPLRNGAHVVLNIENLTGARYLSSIDRYGPPQAVMLGVSLPIGNEAQSDECR